MEQLGSHWTDFQIVDFSTIRPEYSSLIKVRLEKLVLYLTPYVRL
jgi:hypothetical protein